MVCSKHCESTKEWMNNLEGVRKGFAEKADICSYRLRGSIPSRGRWALQVGEEEAPRPRWGKGVHCGAVQPWEIREVGKRWCQLEKTCGWDSCTITGEEVTWAGQWGLVNLRHCYALRPLNLSSDKKFQVTYLLSLLQSRTHFDSSVDLRAYVCSEALSFRALELYDFL